MFQKEFLVAKEVKETKTPVKETKSEPKTKAKEPKVEPKKEAREIKPREEGKSFLQRVSSSIRRFFNETIGELRKVNWPTRREAISLTQTVLAVTVGMAIFLGLLDWLFGQLFSLILGTVG
jgi:preprotein translocase subunit SecE